MTVSTSTNSSSAVRWSEAVWFITGASTGFGHHIAATVLARGGRVIATARDATSLADLVALAPERARAMALDVRDAAAVRAAAREALACFGGVDVLVNNAGHGLVASVEETDDDAMLAVIDVNFMGTARVTRALLPGLRARRRGWIINISSIAGLVGYPGSAFYSASKFAVEGFSESLRAELAPLGIGVMVVEPGFFRTRFGQNAQVPPTRIADYDATVGETQRRMAQMRGNEPGDPDRAAMLIIDAIESGAAPTQLLLGNGTVEMTTAKLRRQLDLFEASRERAESANVRNATQTLT